MDTNLRGPHRLPLLEAIERIEVICEPMSTLYGSDAIGGVINIITRQNSQQWHSKVQTSTFIQENSASGNELSSNFFVGGPLADSLSMRLDGQYTDPAGAYTFVDLDVTYALNSHVTLKAAVYNAFDKQITVEDYECVEDGRRYWLGTDIQF